MDRRNFLALLATSTLGSVLPFPILRGADHGRALVVIDLVGGNDGLNTLIPWRNPIYHRLRPGLSLPIKECLQIDQDFALNPKLMGLADIFERGELAIVRGVGYADPVFSHFRSIDIWDAAIDADGRSENGWLSRVLSSEDSTLPAGAIAVGGCTMGDLKGPGARVLALKDPKRLRRSGLGLATGEGNNNNDALNHILGVSGDLSYAAKKLHIDSTLFTEFPKTGLGRDLAQIARLIEGNNARVYKAALKGFDTHARQIQSHGRALEELSEALNAFRRALVHIGVWNDCLILIRSEFGRRPQENGSRGTDHGSAGLAFFLGGAVTGGLYGKQPDLEDLVDGNLKYNVDFRSLYATIINGWLGGDVEASLGRPFPELPIFA